MCRPVVSWVDISGEDKKKGGSTFNPKEAQATVKLAQSIHQRGHKWKVRVCMSDDRPVMIGAYELA